MFELSASRNCVQSVEWRIGRGIRKLAAYDARLREYIGIGGRWVRTRS